MQHSADEQVYFAAEVARETLVGWLGAWFGEGACRLGMRPDATDLWWFAPAEADAVVAAWPEGRVFDADREVRWERRGDGYAVWVLGDLPAEESRFEPLSGEGWTSVSGRPDFYLWGQYHEEWSTREDEPTWVEVRIPRALQYPVDDTTALRAGGFARLGHVEYRAPNGAVQFTRLTEVT